MGLLEESVSNSDRRGALSILDEKTQEHQWPPPLTYSIEPSRDSRLFDPSPTDDLILPDARPRLHAYEIPVGIGRRSTPSSEAAALAPTDAGPPSCMQATRPTGQQRPAGFC
ncbi:MAG: hypothetical protein ACKVHE_35435 [Planctomycetales bacterium]